MVSFTLEGGGRRNIDRICHFSFCTALFRYSRIFIISPRTTDFALQVAKTSRLLAPRVAILCGKVGQLGKTCLFSAAPVGFLNPRFKICGRYVGKEDEGGREGENYFRFPFSASVYVFMRLWQKNFLEKEGAVKMRDFHVRQKKSACEQRGPVST